jgi:hypothetical protein
MQMKRVLLATAAVLLGSSMALAQSAGYDLFQTDASCTTSVDLSGVSGISPTTVTLKGVPVQSSTGNTDTIISRGAVNSSTHQASLNVYVLYMKNCGTVTLNGSPIDLYISINNSGGAISTSVVPQPDSLPASSGTMTVNTDGTFSSSLTVNADVIFTSVGGNPATSSSHAAAPQTSLSATGTWSSNGATGYPQSTSYPSGGFNPITIHHTSPNHAHQVLPASCGTGGATVAGAPNTGAGLQQKATGNVQLRPACVAVVSNL